MSVSKISSYAVGSTSLNAIMSTLDKAYKGQAQVTLSNYDNDSAPSVKVGSVFDCNGAQYAVSGSDETPTGYSGISNSTTFFLYFDESATAFIYSSTAPTWSDDLQGWYNGNDRALFSMYKDSGGTLYQNKFLMIDQSNNRIHGNLAISGKIAGSFTLGAIGSIIVGCSSSWADSTTYLHGTTVNGSTLYYSTYTSSYGSPLSSYSNGSITISSSYWASYGYTGTWMLLTRVYKGSTSSSYPVGLFQRIA